MGDIIPCYKYYTLQDWWSTFDSNIMEDFISYISFEHPAWVIVMNNSSNAKLEEILNEEYILKKSNSEFTMYKYSK